MADVCLLIEGAYPYVSGGVSSWTHDVLTNLPDVSFALVSIGASPDPQRQRRYQMPSNVVEFREIFINDVARASPKKKPASLTSGSWQDFAMLHEAISTAATWDMQQLIPSLRQPGFVGLTTADLLAARQSWDLLVYLYQRHASQQSFVDFFWTFRAIYLPIFAIFETDIPQASVYHAVSTGFSGLLGALAKIRTGRPLIVTEHGIYTREREMEIMQASWMQHLPIAYRSQPQRMSFFQQWWLHAFSFMEQISYQMADSLVTITQENQEYQQQHGAKPEKLHLIPNGVDIQRFARLQQESKSRVVGAIASPKDSKGVPLIKKLRLVHPTKATTGRVPIQTPERSTDTFRVGFIGRIVPIKDVKTFLRALKIASQTIPQMKAYLVGPTEEDAAYVQECQQLCSILGLNGCVSFTGAADVRTYYAQLDVLVLTSLSEGQPLVILEAMCVGIPVIATDVGACRELLEGISSEDRALGTSGLLTAVASPQETAQALLRLWCDPDERLKMSRAGQKRTQHFYRQEHVYERYRALYHGLMSVRL